MTPRRRLPIGAELQPGGGVHFRVWAPRRRRVAVVLEPTAEGGSVKGHAVELAGEPQGYFSAYVPAAAVGSLYRFRLDDEPTLSPDPASRFQPSGVHGPSQVIDPAAFRWSDGAWRGRELAGQVLYELHVGTFTPEGTYAAAVRELRALRETGITTVELMPVAEFPGRFGWGYDGVDLFAPTRLYGAPDELRRFVDAAHGLGLGVVLDVVYNHFGPSGNYLPAFSHDYLHHERTNEWGDSTNFDGENSAPVREFFISNAGYWIDEFHMDGLRLDATQAVHDTSDPHVLLEISRRVRQAAGGRATLIFSENERQEAIQVRAPEAGGYGLDAVWNDDFHHTAMVVLTGQNEFYYRDFLGTPQELISAIRWGYLYQGQRSLQQKINRGTAGLDLPGPRFVTFLQNHDQVANSARGWRCHALASPGRYRAMTALWLLAPGTPLFFQGQEFAASSPFLYFADHEPELAKLVRQGRFEFLRRFPRIASEEIRSILDDPENVATFEKSKLDLSERGRHTEALALHRDLLKLRREDPVLCSQRADRLHGAVLGPEALLLRYLNDEHGDRLLLVNFAADLRLNPVPEPLLAPPENQSWSVLWSSERPEYGGLGTPPLETEEGWLLPAHAAVVLVGANVE